MASGLAIASLILLQVLQNSAAQDCECVPLHRCVDGEIIDDITNLIDVRRIGKPKASGRSNADCGPQEICCRPSEASEFKHKCGTRNTAGIAGKILSTGLSGESEFGEFPWQAAIFEKESDEDFNFKCGGTLIDENHILTVAHCVNSFKDNPGSLVVRLGEWDLESKEEEEEHEDYGVSAVVIHPEFLTSDLRNDVAVLTLDKNVVFKPHIDTVCLPRKDDDFTGEECVVTGWGAKSYEDDSFSMILKEVNLPVYSRKQCRDMLRKTRLGKRFKLHDSFICAGGEEGLDSCKGDGGGPLVCPSTDSTYTLAGLVAWGIDCGEPGVPGVYVNVGKFVDWIVGVTNKPIQDYWSN